MAIISQKQLFSWENLEIKSDSYRLKLVLDNLPDENLMLKLEKQRANGRNDYPVRAIWNSIIAGVVFNHRSIEELRRELSRNAELRMFCGFDVFKGADSVPGASVYTRFMKNLIEHENLIRSMFDNVVSQTKELLSDFGKELAIDSKAIESYSNWYPKNKKQDGRRDTDANIGKKKYAGKSKAGKEWQSIKEWFGYKLHLLIDSKYELPVGYKITKASSSDTTELLPMIETVNKKHKDIVDIAKIITADKGYDSAENNMELYYEYGIMPIIPIREMWKDGEATRALTNNARENILYDESGRVYCVCDKTGEIREMAYNGADKKRNCIKYRCPAKVYGYKCKGMCNCKNGLTGYGKIVRIKIEKGQRLFVPLPRHTYKWKRYYKKRTAVERVNSRLDVSFGFEKHTIRGKNKLESRMGIALAVMLAMAVGHIKQGEKEKMRSLVKMPKAA